MEDVASVQQCAGYTVAFWGMTHPENTHLELADTFASEIDFEQPRGVLDRTHTMGRMLWSTSARAGIERAIERFRPDVAHLHNVYHQLSPSILGPLVRHGVPVLMTLHDYKLACPTYQFSDNGTICEACLPHRFWEAPKRRCREHSLLASGAMAAELAIHTALRSWRHVDLFICPSQFMARKMAEARVYPERQRVLRYVVDMPDTLPKPSPGGDVVLAARLAPEKGIDTAISAMAFVDGDVHLHIAGDGPIRAELERQAADTAPGRISFHGRLPKERLFELVRSSSVALVPSRWYENQPMAVLEALANAVPVISSDLGGLPELVRPGIDGELVPADDPHALAQAIRTITSNPDKAFEMGRAGRQRILEDFSPAVHLAGLDQLYREAGVRG